MDPAQHYRLAGTSGDRQEHVRTEGRIHRKRGHCQTHEYLVREPVRGFERAPPGAKWCKDRLVTNSAACRHNSCRDHLGSARGRTLSRLKAPQKCGYGRVLLQLRRLALGLIWSHQSRGLSQPVVKRSRRSAEGRHHPYEQSGINDRYNNYGLEEDGRLPPPCEREEGSEKRSVGVSPPPKPPHCPLKSQGGPERLVDKRRNIREERKQRSERTNEERHCGRPVTQLNAFEIKASPEKNRD